MGGVLSICRDGVFPPVFVIASPEPWLKIADACMVTEFTVVGGKIAAQRTAGCKPELSAATAYHACIRQLTLDNLRFQNTFTND